MQTEHYLFHVLGTTPYSRAKVCAQWRSLKLPGILWFYLRSAKLHLYVTGMRVYRKTLIQIHFECIRFLLAFIIDYSVSVPIQGAQHRMV